MRARYLEARANQPDVFEEEVEVSDDILLEVAAILQDITLYHTDLDSKGRAFEQFIGKYFKGDYGQYFTPRNIVKTIVEITNAFKPFETSSFVLDPACGSAGFLLEVLSFVRNLIKKQHTGDERTIDRLEWDFSHKRIFGVEINDKIARVAMMDMVIHEDGHSNIKCHDALDEYSFVDPRGDIKGNIFNFVITNPPFTGDVTSRAPYWNSYDLGGRGSMARGDSQPIYMLFIERCLEAAKDGGIISIVLPDSAFTNIEFIAACGYMLSKSTLLGVLSLPQHTFKPFGSEIKTSVFFFRKDKNAEKIFAKKIEYEKEVEQLFNDKSLTPFKQKEEQLNIRENYEKFDYPILMVHIEKVGYAATGKLDDDLIPKAVEEFIRYIKDPHRYKSIYHSKEFWTNKVYFLDLITKLNVEAYDPQYYEAMDELAAIKNGELKKLEDLCVGNGVQTGHGGGDYLTQGIPIIKTADVVKRRRVSKDTRKDIPKISFIEWDGITDHLNVARWNSAGSKKLGIGDILVQCVAHSPEYIGDKISIVDAIPPKYNSKALALNKFLIIRADNTKINPFYLLRFLASKYGKLQMFRYIRGMTAQIYEYDVKDFIIYVPPEDIQKKLADEFIDLIENLYKTEEQYEKLLDFLDDFKIS